MSAEQIQFASSATLADGEQDVRYSARGETSYSAEFPLRSDSERDAVYQTQWWFGVQARCCAGPHETPIHVQLGGASLPLWWQQRFGVRRLSSLTTEFTTEFLPFGDCTRLSGVEDFATSALRTTDVIRFDCLPYPDPLFTLLDWALASAGWLRQSWFHFGNWFMHCAGLSSDAYLAGRPPHLRRTIKQGLKLLERAGGSFSLIAGEPGLGAALAAYDRVYQASWKPPEIHPGFIPTLVRTAAEAGVLRLGLCHIDGVPAAAQIWLVWNGRATIFKIAYDERFRALSVGNTLTWWMMRHMLDEERVAEVDFGRGDDAYKRWWLPERRERWGLVGFNPYSPPGLALAARHIGGRWLKRGLLRPAHRQDGAKKITAGE